MSGVSRWFWIHIYDAHAACPLMAGIHGYSREPLGLVTARPGTGDHRPHPFSYPVVALGRLSWSLNKLQPELCVCYPATWETGSGIAEGLLWVNISLNLILATTSTQGEGARLPNSPTILIKEILGQCRPRHLPSKEQRTPLKANPRIRHWGQRWAGREDN